VQNGDPLYTAVPSLSDADALLTLRDRILEYLAVREEHSARASLVTFFKPPERSLSEREYHRTLWHILQTLHLHDPEPWPADIPTDPDDPYWEFCLGGEPMFPTCRAPFYEQRKSRYCPVGLEITFQPRALFEALGVTGDTEAGQHARDVIQGRLEGYDGVCPHADLGDWGSRATGSGPSTCSRRTTNKRRRRVRSRSLERIPNPPHSSRDILARRKRRGFLQGKPRVEGGFRTRRSQASSVGIADSACGVLWPCHNGSHSVASHRLPISRQALSHGSKRPAIFAAALISA